MSAKPSGPDPSEGGKARAKALTKTQRSDIARTAADVRWNVMRATHAGELEIAGRKVACAVLEDGRRVLSQQSFLAAIGRRGNSDGAKAIADGGNFPKVPVFLAADNLKPFIGESLATSCSPVLYRLPIGGRAYGYEARLLPLVCEVYLAARRANVLMHNQTHIAEVCEVLVSALAQVGIVALVDEATGYQEVRDRRALQAILDQYLRQAFAAWAKRFPDDFYKEMFRLKGWTWKNMNPAGGPRCVANYTKDLVYARIEVGLVHELEHRNPIQLNGRRKSAHHQWLTEDVGHPALAKHLHAVIALMKACPDNGWDMFIRLIDRALPKRGHSIQLDLFDLDPTLGCSTEPEPPSSQSPPAAPE